MRPVGVFRDRPGVSTKDPAPCGCRMTIVWGYGYVEFCPLHATAPGLLEVCQEALDYLESQAGDPPTAKYSLRLRRLRAVINKAGGVENG
jgi:hypothetical protein